MYTTTWGPMMLTASERRHASPVGTSESRHNQRFALERSGGRGFEAIDDQRSLVCWRER